MMYQETSRSGSTAGYMDGFSATTTHDMDAPQEPSAPASVFTEETLVALYEKCLSRARHIIPYNPVLDAEDVAMTSVERILRSPDTNTGRSVRSGENIGQIGYVVATNVIKDGWRRNKRIRFEPLDTEPGRDTYADPSTQIEQEAINNEGKAQSLKFLTEAELDPDQIKVLLLIAEGYSYQEVAEITGAGLGTVRSRLHRGRQKAIRYMASRGQNKDTPRGELFDGN